LKISEGEKKSVGVKDLPVLLKQYNQSGNVRYKVASRDEYITGMYSRVYVRLQEHATAKFNISELKKNKETPASPYQVLT
jgi:hypothetical protein